MNSMEGTARVVDAFVKRVKLRVSQSKLSEQMGHARTFLVKTLGHERGPRVGDLWEGLIASGDELPGDLYHQAFEEAQSEPLKILACNRRRQGLPEIPFLKKIRPQVLALASIGLDPAKPWTSRLARIRGYERLLAKSRHLSQAKLERAVWLGVALLERWRVAPPAALTDLGAAISSLSVLYRTSGHLDAALDALLLAYPLLLPAKNPLAEGLWFQKSAYLLARFERFDRATEFVKEAAMRFIEAAATADLNRTLVDLGHMLSRAGFGEEACLRLSSAIRLLAPDDHIYLCAAHQILAGEKARLGLLEEASRELERARILAADSGVLLARIHWSSAKIYSVRGVYLAANEAYQAGLKLQIKYGEPVDVASIALEYAGLLLREKMRPELDKLSARLLRYISQVSCVPSIREAIEDFAALLQLGALEMSSIGDLQKRLSNPEGADQGNFSEPDQPNGSICQPISTCSPM